eukprot:3023130-Rhodomonas_salina.1
MEGPCWTPETRTAPRFLRKPPFLAPRARPRPSLRLVLPRVARYARPAVRASVSRGASAVLAEVASLHRAAVFRTRLASCRRRRKVTVEGAWGAGSTRPNAITAPPLVLGENVGRAGAERKGFDEDPRLERLPRLEFRQEVEVVSGTELKRSVLSIDADPDRKVRVVSVPREAGLDPHVPAEAPAGPIVVLAHRVEARVLHAPFVVGGPVEPVAVKQRLELRLVHVFPALKRTCEQLARRRRVDAQRVASVDAPDTEPHGSQRLGQIRWQLDVDSCDRRRVLRVQKLVVGPVLRVVEKGPRDGV